MNIDYICKQDYQLPSSFSYRYLFINLKGFYILKLYSQIIILSEEICKLLIFIQIKSCGNKISSYVSEIEVCWVLFFLPSEQNSLTQPFVLDQCCNYQSSNKVMRLNWINKTLKVKPTHIRTVGKVLHLKNLFWSYNCTNV